jgi:hypothetical protein
MPMLLLTGPLSVYHVKISGNVEQVDHFLRNLPW